MKTKELNSWKMAHKIACVEAIGTRLGVEFDAGETLHLAELVLKYPIPAISIIIEEDEVSIEDIASVLDAIAQKGECPTLSEMVEKV